jgi:hypothetical protein
MHKYDTADLDEDDISTYFASGYEPTFGHANTVAELVFENYGAGWAWLRPEEPAEADEALFVLTDQGRRAVAVSRLLDHGPTVAEVNQA